MITLDFPYGYFSGSNIDDLEDRLNMGIVEFMYMKKDGSVRNAKGTRNLLLDVVGFSDVPMGLRNPPSHVLTYFDTDKMAWRCFIKNELLWYNTEIEVDENSWT